MDLQKLLHRFEPRFLMLITALLLGCDSEPPPLRIGTNPWPGYEFLHLAEALGYYDREGVNVQLIEFMSLGDSSRAFERGQVDAWGTTTVELLLSREHSARKAKAFWVTNISAGGDGILAKAPISNLAQLEGKTIGVEPATVDIVMLYFGLKHAGLQLDNVEVVPLSQNFMQQALLEGIVDAVCTYPPFAVELRRLDNVTEIFSSAQIPNVIIDVLAADKTVLEQRREDFIGVIAALQKAHLYARNEPEKAIAIMAQREGISEQEFLSVLHGLRLISKDEQIEYLKPGGELETALKIAGDALNASGAPVSQPALSSMYSSDFVTHSHR